jgi:hypothetical protein
MTIKYAGPRPTISHHGIEFKEGKEDKYVYLMIGIQILQAIDKDYGEKDSYSYDLNTQRVSDDIMINIVELHEPHIQEEIEQEISNYKEKIDREIDNVLDNKVLKKVEKDVWINNINIMKTYRIQRAVNKIYYMHCITNIKDVIKREGIKEIDTPFFEKYWHVLQTLQGALEEGRYSVKTDLKVIPDKNGKLIAQLKIGI